MQTSAGINRNFTGTIRSGLALIRHVFISRICYRWDIVIAIIGNIFYLIVSYYLWKAAFSSRTTLAGYDFGEFFLYITTAWCYRYLVWGNNIDRVLANYIYSGNISMVLIRPLDLLPYFFFIAIGSTCFTFLFAGLPVFAVCVIFLKLPVVLSPAILISVAAFAGAFILSVLLNMIIGMIAVYTIAFNGVAHMKDLLLELLSGMIIPVTMFPGVIQKIIQWLPLPYMASFPVRLILGQVAGKEMINNFCMQLLWIVVLYIVFTLFHSKLKKKIVIWRG